WFSFISGASFPASGFCGSSCRWTRWTSQRCRRLTTKA
ncbi:MAG: hypothetical protein AVDCRST_MAG42-1485, partial [uncultured Chthoniobacterales bacterium]